MKRLATGFLLALGIVLLQHSIFCNLTGCSKDLDSDMAAAVGAIAIAAYCELRRK